MTEFARELRSLINQNSVENGSNTPDFILTAFLIECLDAFEKAVNSRTNWYGKKMIDAEKQAFTGLPND